MLSILDEFSDPLICWRMSSWSYHNYCVSLQILCTFSFYLNSLQDGNKSSDIVKWHSQHVNMTYQCNEVSCLSRIGSHSEMLLPHHWHFLQLPPKAFKVLQHNHQSSEQVSNPYTVTVWSEEFNTTSCTTRHHRSFLTRALKLSKCNSPPLKIFNMTFYWFGGVSICCVTFDDPLSVY